MADSKPVRKRALGAWVIQAEGKVIIENSEMRAYRKAVDLGGSVQFVEFGHIVAPLAGRSSIKEKLTDTVKTPAETF